MSKKLYPEESVQAIADAIRSKNGSSDTYTIDEMSQAISDISGFKLKALPTGAISSISDGADDLPLNKLKVSIEPIQSGSGDPSPENIRPISGWSEANVSVCGANVWDEEWEVGAISNSNGKNYALAEKGRSKNYISVKPNTPYYLYLPNTYSSARIACYDKDKEYLGQATGWLSVNNNTAFTTPSNTYYIRFVVVKTDATYNNDISINYPSTDTSYHAYNGQTITIDLDGTRYGGSLDVVSGELTVDRAYKDMGTINWVYSENAQVFGSNQFTPYVLTNGKLQSSQYKWNSTPNASPMNLADGEMSASPYFNRQTVMVKDSRYSDATAFKNAMSGVQLVYELATPQEIQLTQTQIRTLLDNNNIWADSGEVLEGEYFAEL